MRKTKEFSSPSKTSWHRYKKQIEGRSQTRAFFFFPEKWIYRQYMRSEEVIYERKRTHIEREASNLPRGGFGFDRCHGRPSHQHCRGSGLSASQINQRHSESTWRLVIHLELERNRFSKETTFYNCTKILHFSYMCVYDNHVVALPRGLNRISTVHN